MFAVIQTIIARALFIIIAALLAGIGINQALPPSARIKVPFTSQAPQGVWTEVWQNACEEASIIMIDNFYRGDELTKEKAHEEILTIFDLKEKSTGTSDDESMTLIAELINRSNLNWQAQVVDEPTIEEMKNELANQRPIIAPVYARALDNPFYTGEGPDYHVLVIVGYDDTTSEFITHDPGTARGENFRYGYQELYDAINDFLTTTDYTAGPTRVLFTSLKPL